MNESGSDGVQPEAGEGGERVGCLRSLLAAVAVVASALLLSLLVSRERRRLFRTIFDHIHLEVPKRIHPEIPAHRESPRFSGWWVGGWLSPVLVVAFTIGWVFLIYGLVGTRTRSWEYGTVSYVPGETISSSQPVPSGPAPRQVVLPIKSSGGPGGKR